MAGVPLGTATSAAAWLLTYAVHSTIALGGVWLLLRVLRRRVGPRREDVLWKSALLVPLVTAGLQVLTGVGPSVPWAEAPPGPVAAATRLSGSGGSGGPGVVEPAAGGTRTAPSAGGGDEADVDAALAARWPRWLVAGWGAGALLFVTLFEVRRRRFIRALGRRRAVDDPRLLRCLRELRAELGIRRAVCVTRSRSASSPMVVGRGEICIPDRATRELGRTQIRSLLGHELAHLRRRDPGWLRLAGWIEALFFFQPLHRVARRRLETVAEHLSDRIVARRLGLGRSLARTLVDVAEWIVSARRSDVGLAGMIRQDSRLSDRIRRLLDPSPAPGEGGMENGGWHLGVVAMLAAAMAFGAPGFEAATGSEHPTAADSADGTALPGSSPSTPSREWRVLGADLDDREEAVRFGRAFERKTATAHVVPRLLELLDTRAPGLYVQLDDVPPGQRVRLVGSRDTLARLSLAGGGRVAASLGSSDGPNAEGRVLGVLHAYVEDEARSVRLRVPARPFRLTLAANGVVVARAVAIDLEPGSSRTIELRPQGTRITTRRKAEP